VKVTGQLNALTAVTPW